METEGGDDTADFAGATSKDVNQGQGQPTAGQEGQQKPKKKGTGLGGADSNTRDTGRDRDEELDEGLDGHGQRTDFVGAEERAPQTAEDVAAEIE